MFSKTRALACGAATLALGTWLVPLQADPGDFEFIADTVATISSKSLDAPAEQSVYSAMLEATAWDLEQDELRFSPLLRTRSIDASMDTYVRTIQRLARDSREPERYWIERSLKSYLRSLDANSDFLTAKDVDLYRAERKREFAGVGMELERDKTRNYICIPFPGMAAARKGINWGDTLIAVNSRKIKGRPLIWVASMIRGQADTPVRLTVDRPGFFQRSKTLVLNREPIKAPAILSDEGLGGEIIRILTFNGQTLSEIRRILENRTAGRTLTLDVRGCPGGSLQAAVAIADLFLAKEKRIVSLQRASDVSHLTAVEDPLDSESPLVIRQDEKSASAAEVLIAALCINGRARSVGTTTRGKGTLQEIIPVGDGCSIILTTARLLDPMGQAWEGRGLPPAQ